MPEPNSAIATVMDRTQNALPHLIATAVGLVLSAASSAYMLYLRVPSVLAVRPELKDVGLVTGLFSGRGEVYLYHHYPVAMVVITAVFIVGMLNLWTLR